MGWALDTTAFTLIGHHVIPLRRHRLNYGLEKPKLSFLKSLGLRRLCEKFQVDKLEPKADKMHLHRTPKTVGYTS